MSLIQEYYGFWLQALPVDFFRYFIAASAAFALFYVWAEHPWRHKRIFPELRQTRGQFLAEFARSMRTILVFSLTGGGVAWAHAHGYTQIYLEIGEYGWAYLIASAVIAILLHDAYFYWTHRLMHTRALFRVFHRAHHTSIQPSPWAAYSFSLPEALVEAAILPIVALLFPMHPLAFLVWMIFMIVKNVAGHVGFELFPRGFIRHPLTRWNTTTTHHELHHRNFQGNYGLYFTWWDRWMKTERADYARVFEEVATRANTAQPASANTVTGGAA